MLTLEIGIKIKLMAMEHTPGHQGIGMMENGLEEGSTEKEQISFRMETVIMAITKMGNLMEKGEFIFGQMEVFMKVNFMRV